jgi:CBS domain containing-hemolysin-like protein
MGFLDNALSLITLLSLFLVGPALGRALVASFYNWQNWWLPFQHLAIGLCTLIAVAGMVLLYGALWKLSPKSVAWYGWIHLARATARLKTGKPTRSPG